MDMSLYRDLFVSEAREHLSAFSERIIHLEGSSCDSAAIDELFRHAHSLKGMAATMGFEHIVTVAHAMENKLSQVRDGKLPLQPALVDLLLEGSDTLSRQVSAIEANSEFREDTAPILHNLANYDQTASPQSVSGEIPTSGISKQSLTGSAPPFQARQTDSFKSVRIKTETLDHLVNITGELITNRYRLAEAINLADATAICHEPLHQLTSLLRSLRDEIFKARMLPFSFIAERFPRLVRDLSRKQGKEVQFKIKGEEIELDRGILEEIADPIVHLLRNAIDHGLESADERVAAGKPFGGSIIMTVSRDKDHVEIAITDDGRGMDPEQLKRKAIEKGIISTDQALKMPPQEAYKLICYPGFSTAATVTDISGRGVGMDAVSETVHALVGLLTIQSQHGKGSRFTMRLPITVSIINALIVKCGPFEIALPLNVVTRTMELKPSEITMDSGVATILLDGVPTKLRSLEQAMMLPAPATDKNNLLPVIICDVSSSPLAFSVEHITGQQEIFVRPLRSPLSHLKGMSGATVTGDGRILFVADISALI